MEIGAQLYTVREHTKTLEDFSRTLEKIAAIGYRNVQVSGTCAYEPAWLKAELDRTGLRCVLTHTDPGRIAAETDAVAAEHQAFGWPVTRRLRKPTGRWGGGWRPWAAG